MWLYQNKEIKSIEDLPKDVFGFIYIITNNETGKFYIGKKLIQHKKTKKLGKKAIALQEGRGRKKMKEVSYQESDWIDYWGSCKPLLEDIQTLGENKFKKEILIFAYKSKQLNYLETKTQFVMEVLEVDTSYNTNISGRFFRPDTHK